MNPSPFVPSARIRKSLIVLSLLLFPLIPGGATLSAQSIYSHVPAKIDTSKNYLFYLHGRIIEVRGVRPTSPRYGVYEYEKILQTFADSGFVVISEARGKDTKPQNYAKKVVAQIDTLLRAGIKPSRITVVGASKGAGIAVLVSSYLKNDRVNFVIIAICNKRMARYWAKNDIHLWGRVLYIYDRSDVIAGSCKDFLSTLKSEGLREFKEIELNLGLGHGVLYRPLKEWVVPAVRWARGG